MASTSKSGRRRASARAGTSTPKTPKVRNAGRGIGGLVKSRSNYGPK